MTVFAISGYLVSGALILLVGGGAIFAIFLNYKAIRKNKQNSDQQNKKK